MLTFQTDIVIRGKKAEKYQELANKYEFLLVDIYMMSGVLGFINNQKDVQDMTGTFKLLRSNELSDFKTWDEILRFTLSGKSFLNWSWKDFTIQQGIRYKYALQQYNGESLLDSNKLISESIYADFEHSFLYDGERQLKIKYNPKVASFKNIVLETKTNTIVSINDFTVT